MAGPTPGRPLAAACSIESIIAVLRSGLQSAQHKPKDQVAIAALQCLSRLCQSCTADMTPHMVALLELVFALGLSLELTVALAEICQAIPGRPHPLYGRTSLMQLWGCNDT